MVELSEAKRKSRTENDKELAESARKLRRELEEEYNEGNHNDASTAQEQEHNSDSSRGALWRKLTRDDHFLKLHELFASEVALGL